MFLGLAAVVAAVPGLQGIQSGVGTPPEQGKLFGGVLIACGALAILGLYLFRAEVAKMTKRRAVIVTSVAAATFLVFLGTYLVLLDICTVTIDGENEGDPDVAFYFPLWPRGDLGKALEEYSRQDAALRYRRAMQDYLDAQGFRRTSTTLLLMFLYVLSLTSLTFAFGFLGMRVGSIEEPPAAA